MNAEAGAEAVASAVRALQDRSLDGLREVWAASFSRSPSRIQSPEIFRRMLADQLQHAAFGTDQELERRLRVLVRAHDRRKPAPVPPPHLRIGAVLWREFAGETHRVEVLEEGFRWKDQTFKSLSQIARAITGTRWNGPKFFGLREAQA